MSVRDKHSLESSSSGQYRGLNERHYVERGTFAQMAPAVVRLELTRLTTLMGCLDPGSVAHTAVVAARHQLRLFQGELIAGPSGATAELNTLRLDASILCLTIDPTEVDTETYESMIYVVSRLGYIAGQMRRLR